MLFSSIHGTSLKRDSYFYQGTHELPFTLCPVISLCHVLQHPFGYRVKTYMFQRLLFSISISIN